MFFYRSLATEPPCNNTLSLHDALPISRATGAADRLRPARAEGPVLDAETRLRAPAVRARARRAAPRGRARARTRSEEHTSELQSHSDLVCRLLLEKKKKKDYLNIL